MKDKKKTKKLKIDDLNGDANYYSAPPVYMSDDDDDIEEEGGLGKGT